MYGIRFFLDIDCSYTSFSVFSQLGCQDNTEAQKVDDAAVGVREVRAVMYWVMHDRIMDPSCSIKSFRYIYFVM